MTEAYTRTNLAKKLGLEDGHVVILHHFPEHYFDLFSDFPKSFQISGELRSQSADFIHLFVHWEEELSSIAKDYCRALKKDALIWISWPRDGYPSETDLKTEGIKDILSTKGLSHVGELTIDGHWNAIGFRCVKIKSDDSFNTSQEKS